MKNKKNADKDIEEVEEELDPKEEKKKKREEAAEKRRKERQKDKAARWSGIILLTIIMIVGFLMWVSGEVREGGESTVANPLTPSSSTAGKVIVR